MLDIGGNIGAHTSFIGKHGYSVITFEALPRNYYILKRIIAILIEIQI